MTLQEILDAKERRATAQKQLIDKYGLPIICLTALTPGSVKRTPNSLFIINEGEKAVICAFDVVAVVSIDEESGGYTLFAVDEPARQLKQSAVTIEDTHEIGRLFDLDVIDTDYKPISRVSLGYPPRKCLICDNPAAVCARAAAHDTTSLITKIQQIIDAYITKE